MARAKNPFTDFLKKTSRASDIKKAVLALDAELGKNLKYDWLFLAVPSEKTPIIFSRREGKGQVKHNTTTPRFLRETGLRRSIETGRPSFRTVTGKQETAFKGLGEGAYGAMAMVPLNWQGRAVAVLGIARKNKKSFSAPDKAFIKEYSLIAAPVIYLFELTTLKEQFHSFDPVTGLKPRSYIMNRLDEEVGRADRFNGSFAFLMILMDGFNGNKGRRRKPSTEALRKIAAIIEPSVRSVDVAARFDESSFATVLTRCDEKTASIIGERIRKEISEASIKSGGKKVTVSVGIAIYPQDSSRKSDLVETAEMIAAGSKKNSTTLASGKKLKAK